MSGLKARRAVIKHGPPGGGRAGLLLGSINMTLLRRAQPSTEVVVFTQ